MKGLSGSRVAPRACWPAPAAPRAWMQRFMFPIRGFRLDFPFVTPPVTCLVELALMFHEYVAAPTCVLALPPLTVRASAPPGRHIAVTLPCFSLEVAAWRTYAYSHAGVVSAYRTTEGVRWLAG